MERAKKYLGRGVEWVGYSPNDNGKWIISKSALNDDMTFVIFQDNEFTQSVHGYVVLQDDGTYHTYDFCHRFDTYFKDKDKAIEFVKSKKDTKYEFKFEGGRSKWIEIKEDR